MSLEGGGRSWLAVTNEVNSFQALYGGVQDFPQSLVDFKASLGSCAININNN
jgi:hypothetical protein